MRISDWSSDVCSSDLLLMVVACALYAAYTVALRRRPPVSGIAMFAMLALSAMLSSLPLLAIETWVGRLLLPSPVVWAVLVYVVVFPSFISQLSFLPAVDLVGPWRAGLIVSLVPIFAAPLAVVPLGQSFALYHLLPVVFG